MLKADLHAHTKGDPHDKISYSPKELINTAVQKGYQVLAITCHDKVVWTKELEKYARKKKILLISGAEKTLLGMHVVILNTNQREIEKIKNFKNLLALKQKKKVVVIAPHPYYPLQFLPAPFCLGKMLDKNIKCFDAIEYSGFHKWFFNPNKKAVRTAQKYKKPIIATSDSHNLFQFGNSYTLINSKKNKKAILDALRKGQTEYVSKELSYFDFARTALFLIKSIIHLAIRVATKKINKK